jgi:hypothetical protein
MMDVELCLPSGAESLRAARISVSYLRGGILDGLNLDVFSISFHAVFLSNCHDPKLRRFFLLLYDYAGLEEAGECEYE